MHKTMSNGAGTAGKHTNGLQSLPTARVAQSLESLSQTMQANGHTFKGFQLNGKESVKRGTLDPRNSCLVTVCSACGLTVIVPQDGTPPSGMALTERCNMVLSRDVVFPARSPEEWAEHRKQWDAQNEAALRTKKPKFNKP